MDNEYTTWYSSFPQNWKKYSEVWTQIDPHTSKGPTVKLAGIIPSCVFITNTCWRRSCANSPWAWHGLAFTLQVSSRVHWSPVAKIQWDMNGETCQSRPGLGRGGDRMEEESCFCWDLLLPVKPGTWQGCFVCSFKIYLYFAYFLE